MGKLNVAIADDNQLTLDLLGDIVSSDSELQVVGTAKDGESAYRLIKEKQPDVVLLDIVMPKLDGLGVLDKIRSDQAVKNRPSVLMVSAVGNEGITEDAFAKGADYYIMKPFDQKTILDRIKSVRKRRHVKDVQSNNGTKEYVEQDMMKSLEEDVTEIIHEVEYRHISRDISTYVKPLLCLSIIWICLTRSQRFCIRALQRNFRRHRVVWREQSDMQSRSRGAEARWIRSMTCLDIPSATERENQPTLSLLP